MHIKQGFALAHWMLCCALMLLLSMFAYALMGTWYQQLNRMHARCNDILPLQLALDMFNKDIMQAAEIKKVTLEQCILSSPYQHISWQFSDGKLLRRATHYDTEHHRWKKPSSSLLAQNITQGTFQPINMLGEETLQNASGVGVMLVQGAATIKRIGYLRNGNYVPKK